MSCLLTCVSVCVCLYGWIESILQQALTKPSIPKPKPRSRENQSTEHKTNDWLEPTADKLWDPCASGSTEHGGVKKVNNKTFPLPPTGPIFCPFFQPMHFQTSVRKPLGSPGLGLGEFFTYRRRWKLSPDSSSLAASGSPTSKSEIRFKTERTSNELQLLGLEDSPPSRTRPWSGRNFSPFSCCWRYV